MAEIDRFERSLADAFLRLADDVTGAVDAAAVARRVALEHPRRRPAIIRWRQAAVPRLTWVVLLATVLLAALVGWALLAGSRPTILPPIGQVYACPPGSTPDEPGPVDQAGPPEADMQTAFDRRAGRLVAVTNAGNGVETWTFDVCTNTWAQMHPNLAPAAFEWARLVYDIDSDATILVSYYGDTPGSVWAYDLQANVWTEKKAPPTIMYLFLAYDPVSGLVVAANEYFGSELKWTYDVETDAWTPIHEALEPGSVGGRVFAYDASVDRFVAYTANEATGELETRLFEIRTGTWSRSSAQTPAVMWGLGSPSIVYDEAAKRTVIVGNVGVAAYDASANHWETLFGDVRVSRTPTFTMTGTMVYDPVNERLVGPGPRAAVFAFDPGTREWTVLLEPGVGQPMKPPATMPAPTSAPTPTPSSGPAESVLPSPVRTASATPTP